MKLELEEIDRRARVIYMAMDPSVNYVDAVRFAVEDAETRGERLQVEGGHMKLDLHRAEDRDEADWRAKFLMASDPALDYAAAIMFVVAEAEDRDGLVQFAGADPKSLELHYAVKKLLEEETAAGRFISYLDAVRRVEQEQAKR